MTQGERICAVRKKKEMTMEQFGKQLGVTKTAISRIEKGNRGLTEQMLVSICREFGVNEAWLRTGEGGDENMFAKLNEDDRFSINLGKLSQTENQMAKNMLNAIAASLDLELSEGSLEEQYDTLKSCLMTLERYECNRLR